jgi:hypothetical protein
MNRLLEIEQEKQVLLDKIKKLEHEESIERNKHYKNFDFVGLITPIGIQKLCGVQKNLMDLDNYLKTGKERDLIIKVLNTIKTCHNVTFTEQNEISTCVTTLLNNIKIDHKTRRENRIKTNEFIEKYMYPVNAIVQETRKSPTYRNDDEWNMMNEKIKALCGLTIDKKMEIYWSLLDDCFSIRKSIMDTISKVGGGGTISADSLKLKIKMEWTVPEQEFREKFKEMSSDSDTNEILEHISYRKIGSFTFEEQ